MSDKDSEDVRMPTTTKRDKLPNFYYEESWYDDFGEKEPILESDEEWKKCDRIIDETGDYLKLKYKQVVTMWRIENSEGKNLLHLCVKHGAIGFIRHLVEEIDEYLINNKSNVNLFNRFIDKKDDVNKQTPLSMALNEPGFHEIVEILLDASASYAWDCVADKSGKLRFGDKRNFYVLRKHVCDTCSFPGTASFLLTNGWKLKNVEALKKKELTYCANFLTPVIQGNVKQVRSMLATPDLIEEYIIPMFHEIAQLKKGHSSILITKLFLNRYELKLKHDISSNYSSFTNIDSALVILDHYPGISFPDTFLNKGWTYKKGMIRFGDLLLDTAYQKLSSFDQMLTSLFYYYRSVDKKFNSTSTRFKARLHDLIGDSSKLTKNEYFEKCMKEIEKMKEKKISESLTVYDIFIKSIDDMVSCARNDNLIKSIRSNITKKDFPIYYINFEFKIDSACRKRAWIDQSIDALSKCLPPIFKGNRFVLENIVNSLGVPNLLNLVDC